MSLVPIPKHLASGGGRMPRQRRVHQQAPLGQTRKGSKWPGQDLAERAMAASRTENSYLAAQYARLRVRRGANKATVAAGHTILTAAWHMLQTGETYNDRGADYFASRDQQRTRRRLVAQLERLGVTLEEGLRQRERDFQFSVCRTRPLAPAERRTR